MFETWSENGKNLKKGLVDRWWSSGKWNWRQVGIN